MARVASLLNWLLPRCLRFVRAGVAEVLPSMDGNLALSAMRLLSALLPAAADVGLAAGASPGVAPGAW